MTIPSLVEKEQITVAFWDFVAVVEAAAAEGHVPETAVSQCREIAGAWLFRSRLWSRAYLKPHGYAGDFRMVEWMYDLETDACADPSQPAIVNCLDHLMRGVHSVVSVWQRRHWFSGLLRQEYERRGGALRVLDIAAGGARYVRDFLQSVTPGPGLEVTLLDQDAAAIAFCRQELVPWSDRVRFLCTPIRDVAASLKDDDFDVIISAGLFDYLDDGAARHLLAHLATLLSPGGTVAFSNFHPGDPSRKVKEWLVDWPLVFRNESQCAALFPQDHDVEITLSGNEALVLASARGNLSMGNPVRRMSHRPPIGSSEVPS